MEELYRQLEIKIRTLAERCQALLRDNVNLMHQKEALHTKNKVAISQIEDIVSHLKSIERTHD